MKINKAKHKILSTYVVEHDSEYDLGTFELINKYTNKKNWVVEYNGTEQNFIRLQRDLGYGGVLESRFSTLSYIKRHLTDIVSELEIRKNNN